MEVTGDLNPVFGATLIQLDGTRLAQIRNTDLLNAIDKLASLSSAFVHSPCQLTSVAKFIANTDQRLYLCWKFDASSNKSLLLGFVKTGRKSLYLFDKNQAAYEGEFVCVLDAYVHQAHQRVGVGRRLFDFMFQMEHTQPEAIALDNPSVALLGFFAKAYGLDKPVWQNTNFVVFQQLFDLSDKQDGTSAPVGWRRESIPKRLGSDEQSDPRFRYLVDAIPGHPAKSRPHELIESKSVTSAQIDETLSTRSARTRQRKQELLASKPLWIRNGS